MAAFDFTALPPGQTLDAVDSRWRRFSGSGWPNTNGSALQFSEVWDDYSFYFQNGQASVENYCRAVMTGGVYDKKSLTLLTTSEQLGIQVRLACEGGLVYGAFLDVNGSLVDNAFAAGLNIPVNAATEWVLVSRGTSNQVSVQLYANGSQVGSHVLVPPQAGWPGFGMKAPGTGDEQARSLFSFSDAEYVANHLTAALTLGDMQVSGQMTGKMRLSATLELGGLGLDARAAVSLSAAGSAVLGGITVLGHVNTGMQARGLITMGGMAVSGGVVLSDFYSLLPPNASDLEKAIERVIARRLAEIEVAADKIPDLWNPWRCPVAWLETLADAVSVDVWSNKWTDETKRQVIAVSIAVHRIKGTVAAVRLALVSAGLGGAKIIEGAESSLKYDGSQKYDGAVQYGGASSQWAQFDVVLTKPVSAEQAALSRLLVEAVAPARCELREIRYQEARIYDGTYQYDGSINYQPITVY